MTSSREFDRDVLETVVDDEGPPRWRRWCGVVTAWLSAFVLAAAYVEWMVAFLGREFILGGGVPVQVAYLVGLLAAAYVGRSVGSALASRLWLTPAERALMADDGDEEGSK